MRESSCSPYAKRRGLNLLGRFVEDEGIITNVLAFLVGHGFYVSSVCRKWELFYANVIVNEIDAATCVDQALLSTYHTLGSAAFASHSCILWAAAYKLPFGEKWLQRCAGMTAASNMVLSTAKGLGLPMSTDVAYGAAQSGSLLRLSYLHCSLQCDLTGVSSVAAQFGGVAMMKWLEQQKGVSIYDSLFIDATRGGDEETLRYLSEKFCPKALVPLLHCARFGAILWLHSAGLLNAAERTKAACLAAAEGQLDSLQFLKLQCMNAAASGAETEESAAADSTTTDPPAAAAEPDADATSVATCFTAATMQAAVAAGYVRCRDYLVAQNCPFDAAACYRSAVVEDHVHMLQWCAEQQQQQQHDGESDDKAVAAGTSTPCSSTAELMRIAVEAGSLQAAKHLVTRQGARLRSSLCRRAASAGQLHVLMWLHSCSECAWDSDQIGMACVNAAADAAGGNKLECLKWVATAARTATWSSERLTLMLDSCGRHGRTEAADFMLELGAQFPDVLFSGARSSSVAWRKSMIEWARFHGCDSAEVELEDGNEESETEESEAEVDEEEDDSEAE